MAKEDRETNVEKNEAVDVKGKNAQVNSPKSLNSSKFDPFSAYKDKLPFPQALIKPKKDHHYCSKRSISIFHYSRLSSKSLPMPNFSRVFFLTKKLSDIYLWKNPSKLQDLGIPTLSCVIGSHNLKKHWLIMEQA
ncbi:hypothetical protein C1H46_018489 [Malus baccata]|uniref:Uncharacterized protein n=1 Tax=Malus baccata TaxID=106549 RepID=A0A540MB15_MALBA|nr:hypothetical protein C1H46_018489 [Malus baccata]